MSVLGKITGYIFKKGESMISQKEHAQMCETVQLRAQLYYRDYLDEKMDKLESNLKDHIDKRTNGRHPHGN